VLIVAQDKALQISCIVPVFNQAHYLSAALESIFAQTLPVSELIVVDDGSTDDVKAVLAKIRKQIRYVRQENAGPAAARNRGVRMAQGEWLSFLDGDDLWHPEKLERQFCLMQSRPDVDYCLAYRHNFWEASMADEEARLRAIDHPVVEDAPGYDFQSLFLKKSVFEKVGYINEALRTAEDTDWLVRAQDLGLKCEVIEKVLFQRRLHTTNISYQTNTQEGYKYRQELILGRIARRKREGNNEG
jgi:glycosyltransferase involved in cell wall biosynthesis